MSDYKFEGWLGHSPESAEGKMTWGEYEPKPWEETDVDIKVECCGVCGSDIHTLRSGWGPTPYPCCVGHEIIGNVVRVGANVKHLKLGDRVGVGHQAQSCLQDDCFECSNDLTPYCLKNVNTYGAFFPNGGKSMGGYAKYHRADSRFAFKIPDGISSTDAAPLLCAGITVWSPLIRNGAGPGKSVGIVGVGGVGHLGVKFAKALGCHTVGLSRKASKKDEVLELGADKYIATDDDKDWVAQNERTLDLIICTVSSEKMPLMGYLSLLKTNGAFIQIGAPDGGLLPAVNAFPLILKAVKIGGSTIGSPAEMKEMLQFAADKGVKPWVQVRPMSEANSAIVDIEEGKARYRYVLVNEA